MPNWKKVITSGSDAKLNEITASGGILTSQNIMPDVDNTLSLGSSTQRFQLNGGTPVTVDGSGTSNTITRFQSATTVENSTISNSDTLTTIVHDNDGNDIFIVSGSNGELIKVTDTISDTLFQVNDISGIAKLQVSSSGLTTTNDVSIDGWGSVSASLASLDATSNPTLQNVTDNGATTTNTISVPGVTINSTGSDFLKFGYEAGYSNPNNTFPGNGGVIIGTQALKSYSGNTGGVTIIGDYAAASPTVVGDNITLIGTNVASNPSTKIGDYTTAIGFQAITGFSGGGNYNTIIGSNALYNHHGGSDLIAIGYLAGPQTLTYTGSGNFYIGRQSGEKYNTYNLVPQDSIYFGNYTKSTFAASLGSRTENEIVIGHYVTGSGTNTVTIGNSSITNNYFSGDISGSDVYIDNWGSLSASLASLDASIYGDSDVTDHINSLNVHSGSHLGTATTDDLPEGSTNRYYTTARVKTKLNNENVISGSVSSPSQGTLSINGNNIDLGLQVGDSPTFTDLTLTGNLTVEGTRTELQVTELNVEDKNITVASGAADSAAADGAGLTIDGANETLTWNHANSRFQFSDDLRVDGLLNIGSVSNAGTDTDKFLVLDSNGNVDFRTGTEVLSDIGAASTSNLSGASTELAFFSSTTEVTSSIRTKITENIATGNVLIHHGQLNVINDPTNTGNSAMQIIVGSGSTNDVSNPQYDSFLSMEHEGGNGTQVAFRASGVAPTSAQIKMRTDVNDAYSIGRLIDPYGANTLRIKPTVIAEGGLSITGSLTVSGSNTFRNIGPAQFSGSVNIRTSDQVQATTDTDKFVVLDGNQLKYRTGTEIYDDIGVTALSSSIASDIADLSGGIITPIQLTIDCKATAAGHVPWSSLSDLQANPNRAYTTWIAPTSGYLEKVIVSPEQTNTTAGTARLQFIEDGTTTETISVTMGAAGTNKTFTFTPATTAFSAGDRLSLKWDKLSNTADLYNLMVVFRLSN